MSNKIFVGNLSWNTDEQALREVFGEIGQLDQVNIIKDRETDRSRGFAFITYINAEDAQTAIEKLDSTTIDERRIKVSAATDRSGGGGGYRGGNNDGGYRGGNNDGGYRGGNNDGGYRGGNNDGGYRGGNNDNGYRGGNNDGGYRGGNNDGEYRF